MKKLLAPTAFAFGVLSSTGVFSAEDGRIAEWNATKSMTSALEHTINVSTVNPREQLVGKDGPSPSNQALVVMLTQEGAKVLMCKDYDLRKLENGNLRPTHGALKASFGFGLPEKHAFNNSFEALVNGPANSALYNLFDQINRTNNIRTAEFVYSEGGKEWGPAVTIPLFLTGDSSALMEFFKAEEIVNKLNQIANKTFTGKKEDDIMTGRFRDFSLIPLESLIQTGNDQPAVMDESKLEMIKVNGNFTKLWDENQMRKNLLPHVAAFADQFYTKES